jgi:hypothetical protein
MRARSSRWTSLALVGLVLVGAAGCSSSKKASSPVTSPTTTVPRTYKASVVSETVISPAYRQGVARFDGGWVFSLDDRLYRTDDALHEIKVLDPAIPAEWKQQGYDHIGDIDVSNGVLYAPLEKDDKTSGKQAMLLYDAATLTYKSGVVVDQHHAAFVAVDDETGIAYSMDQFGGRALLRYDTRNGWKVLPPLAMSAEVDRVQGGDVHAGAVWLSTDDATNGVYRVDLRSGQVQSLGSMGHVDGEGEGIDATPTPAGDLHVLSMDAKIVPARLVEMKVTSTP